MAPPADRTTLAAVFDGPGRPLRLEQVALPDPGPGEVLVRVTCCTLCGSDLHSYSGRRPAPAPSVLGHEILGVVEGVGSGVEMDATPPGTRVTWSLAASCSNCYYCTHDMPQKCERLFKYGHELASEGHALSGGLAAHVLLVPGTAVFPVPDALSDEAACPASCATATAAAALRRGGPLRDRCVLILGAGALGLSACAMARSAGAREVLVAEPRPGRRGLALRFGATAAVEHPELAAAVRDRTAGRGVDLALELSGAAPALAASLELLRPGGKAVWVGAVFPTASLDLDPEAVVRRSIALEGVHNYAPRDLAAALGFLAAHASRFPFAELVEAEYPLERAAEALEAAADRGLLRVLVRPRADGPR